MIFEICNIKFVSVLRSSGEISTGLIPLVNLNGAVFFKLFLHQYRTIVCCQQKVKLKAQFPSAFVRTLK